MDYKDSKGNIINDIKDWEKYLFLDSKKEKHWKKGRSAYEIANFLINEKGEEIIQHTIENVIGSKVSFDYGIPEMEVRFDSFGHGREHDVGIFGSTNSGKRVFVGIEAKVDETFNEKISETYLKAKSKELSSISTNSAKRIEGLLKRNFKIVKPEHFDLRYQLLYTTVGTLDAKEKEEYLDLYFLFVIVFKTELYNELKGIENYKDYIQFINNLDSEKIKSDNNLDIHKVRLDNKELYTIYMNVE